MAQGAAVSLRAGSILRAGLALCWAALAGCGVKAPPRPPGGTEVPATAAPAPEEDTVSGETMEPSGPSPGTECPGCAAVPPEQ